MPYGDVAKQQQQAPSPTVENFYKRLEGLESQAKQSTRLLVEVLAQLAQCDNTQYAFLDELEDVAKELATTVSQRADALEEEARHKQRETRMDLQKVGQMVELAQKWTYISIAAIFVWKVIGAAWKRSTPVASLVGNCRTATALWREDQGHAAEPAAPSRACCAEPSLQPSLLRLLRSNAQNPRTLSSWLGLHFFENLLVLCFAVRFANWLAKHSV
ncbi:MAG: hypothetical protein AB2556_21320, partial [Candidatus Thiodiazotropha sp.]